MKFLFYILLKLFQIAYVASIRFKLCIMLGSKEKNSLLIKFCFNKKQFTTLHSSEKLGPFLRASQSQERGEMLAEPTEAGSATPPH